MAKITAIILPVISLTLLHVQHIDALCCRNSNGFDPLQKLFPDRIGHCEDGTKGTPCCGVSSCDWNCCDCKESCRQAGKTSAEIREEDDIKKTAQSEAKIILPKTTNEGESLESVRHELEQRLKDEFGGYHCYDGKGGWDDEGQLVQDTVWICVIAAGNNRDFRINKLKEVAIWLKGAAKQKAIYLRLPGDKVIFV